jgi:hypothetical protein
MSASDFLFLPGGEIAGFALLRGEVWPFFYGHLMAQGRHSNGFLFVLLFLLSASTFCFRLLYCVYRSCFRCLDYMSLDLFFAAEIDFNVFVHSHLLPLFLSSHMQTTVLYQTLVIRPQSRAYRKAWVAVISKSIPTCINKDRSEVRKQYLGSTPVNPTDPGPAVCLRKASLDDIC